MIQIDQLGIALFFAFDDLSRHADDDRVRRDGFHHHRICADATIRANRDRAENFCARADDDVIFQRGVALALVQTDAAERDAVIQRHVVADLRRFADDNAHAVINEKAVADFCARMNFDPGDAARKLRQPSSQQFQIVRPQPMRDAIRPQGVQSRIEQRDFEWVARGGIAVEHGLQIAVNDAEHKKLREMKNNASNVKLALRLTRAFSLPSWRIARC